MLSLFSPVDAAGASVCHSEPSSAPVYPPPLSVRRLRNKKEEDEETIDEADDDDNDEITYTKPIKIIGIPKLEKLRLKSSKGDKPIEGCIHKIEEEDDGDDDDQESNEPELDKVIFFNDSNKIKFTFGDKTWLLFNKIFQYWIFKEPKKSLKIHKRKFKSSSKIRRNKNSNIRKVNVHLLIKCFTAKFP